MATLKDIAQYCGVSVSAVCTAINHPHKISKELREKILAKARELNYFADKTLKVQKVLLILDNYKNHFYGEYYNDVIFGITQRLSELGLSFRILSDFNVDYTEIYDYNGIIFVGKTPDAFLAKAETYRMPYVLAGHPNANFSAPSIYQDSANGLQQLGSFIKSCGHKNIAVITGETNQNDIIWNEFMQAILGKFSQKNLTFYQADYSMVQTVEIAFTNVLQDKKKTLILCSSDLLAYYVYRVARKYKVHIPGDISVTGFDGIFIPRFLDEPQPQLTTIITDRINLGGKAVDLLWQLLKEPKKVSLINHLPMQIRIGHSVRRLG